MKKRKWVLLSSLYLDDRKFDDTIIPIKINLSLCIYKILFYVCAVMNSTIIWRTKIDEFIFSLLYDEMICIFSISNLLQWWMHRVSHRQRSWPPLAYVLGSVPEWHNPLCFWLRQQHWLPWSCICQNHLFGLYICR